MDTGKMDSRTGKSQITNRIMTKETMKSTFSMSEAIERVVIMKKAKNLNQRTIDDYVVNMNYLVEWMQERYGEV